MKSRRRKAKLAFIYCEHCWREDYHVPKVGNSLRSVLLFLTAGVWAIIEPVRCYTCGTIRMRGVRRLFSE